MNVIGLLAIDYLSGDSIDIVPRIVNIRLSRIDFTRYQRTKRISDRVAL